MLPAVGDSPLFWAPCPSDVPAQAAAPDRASPSAAPAATAPRSFDIPLLLWVGMRPRNASRTILLITRIARFALSGKPAVPNVAIRSVPRRTLTPSASLTDALGARDLPPLDLPPVTPDESVTPEEPPREECGVFGVWAPGEDVP